MTAGSDRPVRIGLVGAAGRGGAFRAALRENGALIHAVCDLDAARLAQCARELGAEEQYTDYEAMLRDSVLDAVIVGTPQNLHVPQAVSALGWNIHVLSEVPAAVSLDQARTLETACRTSSAVYMMAENYTYTRPNVLVRELARLGLFGDLYYAEGEYIHDVRQLAEQTPWRLRWQLGIDGVTYPTHSLGPVLQWMAGQRVTSVCCQGSGHHYRDPRGKPYHQDTAVMLCETSAGGLIKVRTDLVSARPHAMTNYQLQGTEGVYESARAAGEINRVWLRSESSEPRWQDLEELAERYLPEMWRRPSEAALRAGHGGGDYFEIQDFLAAVRGVAEAPIGIHRALDMTLPGLISQDSIAQGGVWLPVPDSRAWAGEQPHRAQLHMIWPHDRLDTPPETQPGPEYEIRQYREEDSGQYIRLMSEAGFGWAGANTRQAIPHLLPGGFFVAVHRASGRLVAAAHAGHRPTPQHPYGGEMGWVAADPTHSGKGLGRAICAAATRRLVSAGYSEIYLLTDDFRLPAISVYLDLGYVPLMVSPDMEERWSLVHEAIRAGRARRAPAT